MTEYVELHARSAFSFLEGSSTPEELACQAAELNMPALAILDRDNVSGAARFHMAAKKLGLRAHIGAEVTCTDGRRYPLLAESRTGYQNLCRLITRLKMRAKKGEGAATLDEFAEFGAGLVCLVSEPYPAKIERLAATFSRGNVFIELQRHRNRAEEERNQALARIARSLNLPLLATNGVSHATPAARGREADPEPRRRQPGPRHRTRRSAAMRPTGLPTRSGCQRARAPPG